MAIEDFRLSIKCGTCSQPLLRIPKPQGDQVICVTCRAIGDYQQIINDPSAGLIGGSLTPQERDKVLDYLGKL